MFPAWCFRQRKCMVQGLVNRVFNETWTHSCLQFEWFLVHYGFFVKVGPFFFLGSVSLSLLYPSFILIFDTLCVCVCVGVVSDFTNSYFFSVYVCMYVLKFLYIYIYIYIYTYIYICLFPFVCVCMIHVLFNFRLSLSITFFSFIWSMCSRSFDILALFKIFLDYIYMYIYVYI